MNTFLLIFAEIHVFHEESQCKSENENLLKQAYSKSSFTCALIEIIIS